MQRLKRWGQTALRTHQRVGEVHGGYLASAVTLSAFLSLFPLLLALIGVIGFFTSSMSDLPGRAVDELGLSGEAATAVVSAMETAEDSRTAASIIGLIGLLWSGLGLVGALQLALDAVWQTPGRGMKDKLWGLAWLGGAAIILAASVTLTALVGLLPGPAIVVALVAALVVDVGLWLWTFTALTNRDVGWRAFLPGAVLGAVGLEVLKAVGAIYVPRAVASSSALYGTLGVVFAILAWLLFFGRLLVYAAVLNVVRWEQGHGTVTAEIEVPKIPGEVALTTNRAGEIAQATVAFGHLTAARAREAAEGGGR